MWEESSERLRYALLRSCGLVWSNLRCCASALVVTASTAMRANHLPSVLGVPSVQIVPSVQRVFDECYSV
jgi:hypothetical protein